MSYPLSKLKARVKLGVQRSDVESASAGYADFINDGIKELEDKFSFRCMKAEADVTILQGTTTIALPANFKELQPKGSNGSPVSFVLNDPNNPGSIIPVEVQYESQEIARLWAFGWPIAVWFGQMRVYMRLNAANSLIGLSTPAPENLTFRVCYYGYLPALVQNTDESPLANEYPIMVIEKAKALAFTSINDQASAGAESISQTKFSEATRKEARQDAVGRNLHM